MTEWNNENKNKLIELWNKYTDKELSEIFSCSKGAIEMERRRLRLIRSEKTRRNTKKYNLQEVAELFKNKNYTLLENEFVNYTTKMNYKCNKHPECIQKITLADILRGRGCYYCGRERTVNSKKHSDEYYKSECEKRNFTYVDNYVNDKYQTTCVRYICNNHKDIGIQEKLLNNFAKCTCCPYCKSSKGEEKLKNILDNLGLHYIRQKRFCDCKDKYALPFDFYLDSKNVAIEYDGEFHYIPFKLSSLTDEQINSNFENYVKRDNIKTEYCNTHKIPLIRIPYWEYDNMESFLLNKLHKININC